MNSIPFNAPEVLSVPWIVVASDPEVRVPPTARTLAGFRAWARSDDFPERGRISFLDQEIFIDLTPEELETHNKVKVEIGRVLGNLNKKLQLGEFYADGALLTNEAANLSTEPDASFVTWVSLEADRVRLVPREGETGQYIEVEGTPDWVLEVVSNSSVQKDTRRLREQYHRAGIREYWLIDARAEDDLEFRILLHAPADYVPAANRKRWQESLVFGQSFRLVRQRNRVGLWEYTLQIEEVAVTRRKGAEPG